MTPDPTPPLTLPAGNQWREYLNFKSHAGGFTLSDRRWGLRAVAWPLIIIFGSWALIAFAAALAVLFEPLFQPSNSPSRPTIDWPGVLLMGLGALIPVVLLALFLLALKMHRSFSVRVDLDYQKCVCRDRLYGWTIRKREIDLRRARLDIRPGVLEVQRENRSSLAGCLGLAIGLLTGPLGWIILIVTALSQKGNRGPTESSRAEVVRLVISEDNDTQAVITVAQEQIAEAFALAWDEGLG